MLKYLTIISQKDTSSTTFNFSGMISDYLKLK